MNIDEGFRRIGIAVYLVAIIFGLLALLGTGNLIFAGLAALVVLILFHIVLYVLKGFVKQPPEKK